MPLRGHQTRFKVHVLSQPAHHRDRRGKEKAFYDTKMKERPLTNLKTLSHFYALLLLFSCSPTMRESSVEMITGCEAEGTRIDIDQIISD